MENLAARPEFKELKDGLWKEPRLKLEEAGAPRILGDSDIFDSYEYVGNATHSWKNYLAGTFEKTWRGHRPQPKIPEVRSQESGVRSQESEFRIKKS